MKRTPLRRLTRLVTRTPLRRNKRLNPRSAKARAMAPKRAAFVERILEERPRCEFSYQVGGGGSDPTMHMCVERSEHVHEKLTRARGGDILDPQNVLAVCAWHHRWIHEHPLQATELGLLTPSWTNRVASAVPWERYT